MRRSRLIFGRRALLAGAAAGFAVAPAVAAATSHFFTTSDGVRLHYVMAGAQGPGIPTIVFVPGWCMPAWIFAPQIDALSRYARVVVLDPRGQGRSEVARSGYEPARRGRDIAELLARLGPGRMVLAGWSLGVLDVLSWLATAGDRQLAGLVLIDNSVGEGTPPAGGGGSSFFTNLRRQRDRTTRGFVASMFKTPQSPAYLAALAHDAQIMPVESAIALLSYPRPREFWRNALYSTRRPVLYAVTPKFREQASLVEQRHTDAVADLYPEAGHALFVDAAPRFNDAVADLLHRRAVWG
ncbi:microsomal epoxide hydrolase [Humitalea rosea]|uniref:Microsomal epoxide hydrolase n=1 Tax=Humitalea rosea TaxID=990373 RepID=A0A2W7HYJ5_9PROT|nr:alpha/beta hydrolase [Humitalea rosea]PZW39009.1 microsomal epoxide hydrolase [Humitalea rosea]